LNYSKHTKIENLLYSSLSYPGVYAKGYVVFALNEKLFPPENGKKIKISGQVKSVAGDLNQGIQFIDLIGRVKNPINNMDVWATHDRYFYNLFGVPEKTKKVKISLDLKLDEIPDYYPGIQLNWLDANNKVIEMSAIGVIYEDNRVATFAIKDIPYKAKKVALVVRPNKDRRIGIKEGEFWFIP
jgi:hypothetical protein